MVQKKPSLSEIAKQIDELGEFVNPTVAGTILVMMYELADFAKAYIYARSPNPEKRRGYIAEARISAADLLFQLRLIIQQMDWDYDEMLNDGEERVVERVAERKKGQI